MPREPPLGPRPEHPDGYLEGARPSRRAILRDDESGVSEVIGYILVFGIISILLVLGMLAFNEAAEDARNNVIDLRAQSAGTRVADLLVETSLILERHGVTTSLRIQADLPTDFEGAGYLVYLEPAGGGHEERIRVVVPSVSVEVTAPLFSADAPTTFSICGGAPGTFVDGGRINVAFNIGAYPTDNCLFLEAAV